MDLFVPAKPPLGAHDCVGSALKPLRILRPCRLVLHAQRGFRGDEQVHDTLQTLSDNRGYAPPVRKSFTPTAKSPQ